MTTDPDIKQVVREKYGNAALGVVAGGEAASCCSGSACCGNEEAADPITSDLYSAAETATLPAEAVAASLGCGNPIALAELTPGETVLDLGSGGGIDVFLSARRVGPPGKVYGLDMTDEMLALARENQRRGSTTSSFSGARSRPYRCPKPVDVIITNCVINLSADKDRVYARSVAGAEAGRPFRRIGRCRAGRRNRQNPAQNMELWVGCVAGALKDDEYTGKLAQAGFEAVDLEPTRIYRAEDARDFLRHEGAGIDVAVVEGKFMSAFVRARKPRALA